MDNQYKLTMGKIAYEAFNEAIKEYAESKFPELKEDLVDVSFDGYDFSKNAAFDLKDLINN